MAKKTRVGLVAGAGVGAAAATALRKRWGRRDGAPGQDLVASPAAVAFLEHLSDAVRIPTVSLDPQGQLGGHSQKVLLIAARDGWLPGGHYRGTIRP